MKNKQFTLFVSFVFSLMIFSLCGEAGPATAKPATRGVYRKSPYHAKQHIAKKWNEMTPEEKEAWKKKRAEWHKKHPHRKGRAGTQRRYGQGRAGRTGQKKCIGSHCPRKQKTGTAKKSSQLPAKASQEAAKPASPNA